VKSKRVTYYDASHPMVAQRTGDPARGSWTPRSKDKPKKGRRR
jgi:hypothetical protein